MTIQIESITNCDATRVAGLCRLLHFLIINKWPKRNKCAKSRLVICSASDNQIRVTNYSVGANSFDR
jgi:hypothetical protein